MLAERWLTVWAVLAAAVWPSVSTLWPGAAIPEPNNEDDPVLDELEDLRTRYSAVEISRDSEHIKKDLSRVLDLAQQGDLDTEETTFYFMRMHDYDDNNHLDGIELMQAFDHLLEHNNETSSAQKLVAMADNLLAVDADDDGFVSFPEWLSFIRNAKPKKRESTLDSGGATAHGKAQHSHPEQ